MLFFMYDLTGDPKYLDPVRKYIEAEKRMATKIRVDGREIQVRGNLVDYQSGRPIAVDVKTWKTYFLDTPEERAVFLRTGATQWKVTGTYSEDKFPWYPSFFRKPEWPDLQVALENRRGGKRPRPEQLSNAVLAESLSRMIKEAEKIIAEQNDKGTWPILSTQVGAQGSYNIGAYFPLVEWKASRLLSYPYSWFDKTGTRMNAGGNRLKVLPLRWLYGGHEPFDNPILKKIGEVPKP